MEEAVLAGGAAANPVRDYQRKFQEMNEAKRTLDRELSRAKVTANNSVATVVANEWKDANDKVMPVKSEDSCRLAASGLLSRKSSSQSKSFSSGATTMLKQAKGTSRSFDGGTRSLDRERVLSGTANYSPNQSCDATKEGEADFAKAN